MNTQVAVDRDRIAEFCRRNHIRRLSLFGSVLRDDFTPESDVDVLVEFEPGHVVGFRIIEMELELSCMFGGRRADIVSEKFLNHRIRDRVLDEAEVLFHKRPGSTTHARPIPRAAESARRRAAKPSRS